MGRASGPQAHPEFRCPLHLIGGNQFHRGKRKIAAINREEIQKFLTEQARKYSESSLPSMRVVWALTLGWANDCGWLPKNPCIRIKLPKRTGGRKVVRTVLTSEQVKAIAERLEEPYATLVVLLAASGLRIGEAVALRWSDFNGSVLRVERRIFDGEVDAVKAKTSARSLPVDPALLERMKKLGKVSGSSVHGRAHPSIRAMRFAAISSPLRRNWASRLAAGTIFVTRSRRNCVGQEFTQRSSRTYRGTRR